MNKKLERINIASIDSFVERSHNNAFKIKTYFNLMGRYSRSLVRDDVGISISHTNNCLMVVSDSLGLYEFAFFYNTAYE